FSYVRSSAKDHGRQNLIAGEVISGQRVVVVEDLVSTGKSSIQAVKALREAGCSVVGLVSIFTYGLEEARKNLEEAKCTFHSLCNYDALIRVAAAKSYILESDIDLLEKWKQNPATWIPEQ